MKMKFSLRNHAKLVFATLMTGFVLFAGATEDPAKNGVELKYLGNFRNKPVFEIRFDSDKEYVINIRDEYGNTLYRETVSGNIQSKKFMLNAEGHEEIDLKLEVSSKSSNEKVVFHIDRNTKFVEEFRINTL